MPEWEFWFWARLWLAWLAFGRHGALRFGDGSTTVFVEAANGFDIGAWQFDGYASLGATRLKLADDMLLTDADMITSGRFGLTASRLCSRAWTQRRRRYDASGG